GGRRPAAGGPATPEPTAPVPVRDRAAREARTRVSCAGVRCPKSRPESVFTVLAKEPRSVARALAKSEKSSFGSTPRPAGFDQSAVVSLAAATWAPPMPLARGPAQYC